jgi:hypothetical protein
MARAAAAFKSSGSHQHHLDTLDPQLHQLAAAGSRHRWRYRKRAPCPLARRARRASSGKHGRGRYHRCIDPIDVRPRGTGIAADAFDRTSCAAAGVGGVDLYSNIICGSHGIRRIPASRPVFGSAKLTRRLVPERWLSGWIAGASAIDDAVVAAYRSGRPILRASVLQLMGWTASAGEVWLVMQALGQPLGVIDAFILESLGSGVRAAAFMVPGALGVLEASFVLFGALVGLSADAALAISLSKRVRELALGLPGLFVWHWMEGHYLLGRSAQAHANASCSSEADLDSSRCHRR